MIQLIPASSRCLRIKRLTLYTFRSVLSYASGVSSVPAHCLILMVIRVSVVEGQGRRHECDQVGTKQGDAQEQLWGSLQALEILVSLGLLAIAGSLYGLEMLELLHKFAFRLVTLGRHTGLSGRCRCRSGLKPFLKHFAAFKIAANSLLLVLGDNAAHQIFFFFQLQINFVREDVLGEVLAKRKTKLECEKEKQQLINYSHQLQRGLPFVVPEFSNNLSFDVVGNKEHHVHCEQHVLQWSHQFA